MTDCGGCQGLGSHKRWCPEVTGHRASIVGLAAEQCEALGDRVGSNDPGAANILYATAGKLGERARRRKAEWQAARNDR